MIYSNFYNMFSKTPTDRLLSVMALQYELDLNEPIASRVLAMDLQYKKKSYCTCFFLNFECSELFTLVLKI